MFLGHRRNDDFCKPIHLDCFGLKFLQSAVGIFKQWKLSGRVGLTRETFTACIQSLEAMLSLTDHLLKNHGFSYVLPGKFTSDPIEGRFGWYRQANGGNFFMSLKQLLQVEKKIRCLSLLQQRVLQGASQLFLESSLPTIDDNATSQDILWLEEYVCTVNLDELSQSDCSVILFVGGYIARSISRRRKCASCKSLLVKCHDSPPIQDYIADEKLHLIEIADRGGLSVPTEYCFVVCSLAVQVYESIMSDEVIRKKFLTFNNQRSSFIQAICKVAEQSEVFKTTLFQTCSLKHNNFKLILQTAFNCFVKNELKRLNQPNVDAPAKMVRTIRKLTAKRSEKH